MSNFETSPFNYANNNTHKRRAKTPSFSSILLDAIYRSIDDTDGATRDDHNYDSYTTSDHNYDYNNNYSGKSKQRSKMRSDNSTFETLNLGHAIMIDSWMEKQQSEPYDHGNVDHHDDQSIRTVRHKSVASRAAADNFSKIHTSCFAPTTKRETASSRIFTKTKSKAMKICGDLKKNPPKSPTSPGAKIAAFINSIFRNSGNRKPNNTHPTPAPETPSTSTSSLSKTTTPRAKSSSTTSRSVRFYTADEDSSPRMNPSKSRREKAKEIDALMTMIKRNCREREEEASLSLTSTNGGAGAGDEEMSDGDGDGESCGSSDLFELESLSCMSVSRYAEELPVYGTTSLHIIKP